jgi:hypothetical protein
MKKLSGCQRREILRRLFAGERRRALAAEFGVSYDRIAAMDRRRKSGIFVGLPTPAMQAWTKAGRGEQVQEMPKVQIMSVAMSAVPFNPIRSSTGKSLRVTSRRGFAMVAKNVAMMEAAERQKLIGAMWYQDPKLARRLTERSAVDEAGCPR